ncbi:hypothetical protein CRENBAI_010154 [Crenichthys baileyi]|uniref:Uncharacterized protein n=1 Tax=Crenichthys baileyi TaxID=28760 RepID=A0AAV9RRX4_9TELE
MKLLFTQIKVISNSDTHGWTCFLNLQPGAPGRNEENFIRKLEKERPTSSCSNGPAKGWNVSQWTSPEVERHDPECAGREAGRGAVIACTRTCLRSICGSELQHQHQSPVESEPELLGGFDQRGQSQIDLVPGSRRAATPGCGALQRGRAAFSSRCRWLCSGIRLWNSDVL